uniref:Uncharacterized protein n=1 Tax=Acanthochromis polyacanthus TaxID=80966 RepID=A0A3Q1FVP8_9TELE
MEQNRTGKIVVRHRTTGSVRDRPRSGAPRVMDRSDDQYLRTYALRHRYATLQAYHVTWTMQQAIVVRLHSETSSYLTGGRCQSWKTSWMFVLCGVDIKMFQKSGVTSFSKLS